MATDLNMLLKAKKIELEATLNRAKTISNIESELATIGNSIKALEIPITVSTTVKDINENIKTIQNQINNSSTAKSLKLKVELDANIKELNQAVSAIQGKIGNSATMKGVKLDVDIDVQGSAKKISEQLRDIQGTIKNFRGEYGSELEAIKAQTASKMDGIFPSSISSSVKANIESVKAQMQASFGEGLFSTTITRDSQQNIDGLVASFKKGTGEIITESYKLRDNKFELISQTDIDRTEQNTHKIKNNLENLSRSLKDMSSTAGVKDLANQIDALSQKSIIDQSELDKLGRLIKEEKDHQTLLEGKRRLMASATAEMQNMSSEISTQADYYKKLANSIDGVGSGGDLKILSQQLREIGDQYKSDESLFTRRSKLMGDLKAETQKLSEVQVKMYQTGDNKKLFGDTQDLIRQSQELAKHATGLKEVKNAQVLFNQAKENLKSISSNNAIEKENVALERQARTIETVINRLQAMGKLTPEQATNGIKELNASVSQGREAVEKLGTAYTTQLKDAQDEAKKLGEAIVLLGSNTKDLQQQALKANIVEAIGAQDVSALKKYISELKGAEVSTISLEDKTNKMGRAVSEIKVKMKGSGETVEAFTLEMDRAGKTTERSMRQVSSSMVSNKNNSLGMLNQIGVAMKRVPTWIVSMQAFYSAIRGAKYVTNELMTVNAEMTELARVASDDLNLDSMLKNSIGYAKELGGDFHAIMDSLGEITRTFGDFNEQQLLAINNTALIMDNVSDLSMEESAKSLIGTMNAFGIEAENTLHIVDAFNEVDNNFAISTQQIAKGMEKASSTAKTFGVTMEETVGQITAIGSVTMETGEVIGNSLKTIYSRITTHDGAMAALEEVNVAIHKIGEDGETSVRPVTAILGDLAEKWGSLSDMQRQNIGVSVAGRNQLSRFLAVMNNWDTAVEATSTAYNSQNSAMKEQARYMDSYEAKINQMKTRFTELALAIGEAFAGDAMFGAIKMIGDAIEGVTKFIEKFGMLPALFGTIGTAIGLVSGTKGMKGLIKLFSDFGGSSKTSLKLTKDGLGDMVGAISSGEGAVKGLSLGFGGLAKGAKAFLTSTGGIALAIGAVATAVGYMTEKYIAQKQKVQELRDSIQENNEQAIKGVLEYKGNLDELINRYDQLNTKKISGGELNAEETEEYNSAIRQLSEMMPDAISHVDALGNTHLLSADKIREEKEETLLLIQAQKEQISIDQAKKIKETVESYALLTKELKKAKKAQKMLEGQFEDNEKKGNGNTKFQSNTSEDIELEIQNIKRLEREKKEVINQTVTATGEQTVAMLASEGAMKNVSLSAEGLITRHAQLNQSLFDGKQAGEEYEEATKKLKVANEDFGNSVVTTYDNLRKSINDDVSFDKASKVMDTLIGTLPDKVLESTAEFKKSMIAIEDTSLKIATDGAVDVDALVSNLASYGVPLNTAKNMVAQLGIEFENQAIKTKVATDELETYEEELNDVKEAVWEAIDPITALFNLGDGDLGKMSSHIQMLEVLKNSYGDTWEETSKAKVSSQALAEYFGVSESYILSNIDSMSALVTGISGMKVELDESGNSVLTFAEGTSQATKDLATELWKSSDGLGSFANTYSNVVNTMNYATADMKKQMEGAFSGYDAGTGDGYGTLFTLLQEQMNELEGSITTVKDANGDLKIVMADGTRSAYLDSLSKQLEESGLELGQVENEMGQLVLMLSDPNSTDNAGQVFTKVTASADTARRGVVTLNDDFAKFQQTQTQEAKSSYFATIRDQMESFSDQIEIVTGKNGELQLSLDGDTESPWIVALQSQLEQMGVKIDTTKEANGELKASFKLGDETFYFDSIKEKAGEAKKATDEGTKSNKEYAESTKANDGEKTVAEKNKADLEELDKQIEVSKVKGEAYQESLDGIANTPITPKIDLSEITKADGTLETTQQRIKDVMGNMGELEGAIGEVTKILDATLGKTAGFQGIVDDLEALKKASETTKVELKSLADVASSGEIKIGGISKANVELAMLSSIAKATSRTVGTEMDSVKNSLSSLGFAKPIAEIVLLRLTTVANLALMSQEFRNYSGAVQSSMAVANIGFGTNMAGLAGYTAITTASVSVMTSAWRGFSADLMATMLSTVSIMTNVYLAGLGTLVKRTEQTRGDLGVQFLSIQSMIGARMGEISNTMVSRFRMGTSSLVAVASGIPGQISAGVRANMSQASGAMDDLANDMVTRFKSALGIHSPSRVFQELGGFVISGLSKGLSNGNLKDLGTKVFDDFGGGIFDSVDMIKGFLTGDMANFNPSGGVSQWAGLATKALQMTGQYSPANLKLLLYQMQTESGGNPLAKNDWDINAINGDPSIGLMQVIGSTYRAHADPRWNKGQTDPLSSMLASIRYTVSRYGSLANGWRGVGYANGGFVDKPEVAMHGEEGLEVIIPLIEKRRQRGLELWMQAGQIMGVGKEILGGIGGLGNGGGGSPFGTSSGESGESSMGASTAGTEMPTFAMPIHSGFELAGEAINGEFSASASKKKEKPKLESLYKRDTRELTIDRSESYITKANTALKALTENTLKYRNQLKEIQKQEQGLLKLEKAKLSNSLRRQKTIENELKKLKNTGSHTEAQRKRYNALQQEFDNNTKSIWGLENSIMGLNQSIANANVDIYLDYIDEIVNKWNTATETIDKRKETLNFNLAKLEISKEDDIGGQLKIQYDILEENIKLEKTYLNQYNALKKLSTSATKKYGKNSKEALAVIKELETAEKDYRASVLERMKLEKELVETRKNVAKSSISDLKNYYKQVQSMSKQAIELEKEELKKAHEAKMKQYDDEITKINTVYDEKLKSLDADKRENDYQEKLTEMNTERAKLMKEIALASMNQTPEGKKQLSKLQEQLTSLNKEIGTTQADRQDELHREGLSQQKEDQLKEIDDKKTEDTKEYDANLTNLDKQIADIDKYFKNLMEDDKKWKKMEEAFAKGDTNELNKLVDEMKSEMGNLLGGDFSGLSIGFDDLPQDIKDKFKDDNMMDLSNLWLSMEKSLAELSSVNKNIKDLNAKNQNGSNVSGTIITNGSGKGTTSGQTNVAPNLNTPNKGNGGSTTPAKPQRTHQIVGGDTLWDLAQKYYGNPYKWKTIANANKNPDPYKLQIGRKLVIPFDTGGYTGDWAGDSGRIALLHKKELVLNENQTGDILSVVKMLESAKRTTQSILVGNSENHKSKSGSSKQFNIDKLILDFEGGKMSDSEVRAVVDKIIRELSKR